MLQKNLIANLGKLSLLQYPHSHENTMHICQFTLHATQRGSPCRKWLPWSFNALCDCNSFNLKESLLFLWCNL